jgi:hypothetical protein
MSLNYEQLAGEVFLSDCPDKSASVDGLEPRPECTLGLSPGVNWDG